METSKTQTTLQQPVLVPRLARETFTLLDQQLTTVLAWSLLSIFTGLLGLLLANQLFFYFFWMMHLSWGLINLGCWAAIRLHIRHRQTLKALPRQVRKIHHHVLKMLLINLAFDGLYIVISFNLNRLDFIPDIIGLPFQWAVMIQGLALFLLDGFYSWCHWRCRRSV